MLTNSTYSLNVRNSVDLPLFETGGEMASTGIWKLGLHTERLSARKKKMGTLNIIADDYNYALAA